MSDNQATQENKLGVEASPSETGARPKKIWFRAKHYGYGWYPVSWEGWSVLAMYIFTAVSDFFFIDDRSHSVSDTLIAWVPKVFILTVFMIIICEAKGEEARWRWRK